MGGTGTNSSFNVNAGSQDAAATPPAAGTSGWGGLSPAELKARDDAFTNQDLIPGESAQLAQIDAADKAQETAAAAQAASPNTSGTSTISATSVPDDGTLIASDTQLNPQPAAQTDLLGLPQSSPPTLPTDASSVPPLTSSTYPAPSVPPPDTANGVAILCARGTTMMIQLTNGSSPGYYSIEEWLRYPTDSQSAGLPADQLAILQQLTPQTKGAAKPNGSASGDVLSSEQVALLSKLSPSSADYIYSHNLKVNPTKQNLLPVLFTGVRVAERDIVSATPCLNNVKVFYTFGQNFGDVSVSGEILLGNLDDRSKASKTVKTLADFFWKYRVSNRKYPVTVSTLSEKFLVYLVGLELMEIIPDMHILPFVFHGVLLDVSREQNANVNTPSAYLTTTDINNSSTIQALNQRTSLLTTDTGTTVSENQTSGGGSGTVSVPNPSASNVTPAVQGPAPTPIVNEETPKAGAFATPQAAIASRGDDLNQDELTYVGAYNKDIQAGKDPTQNPALTTLGASILNKANVENDQAVKDQATVNSLLF